MTQYLQYNPDNIDANNQVSFNVVRSWNIPAPVPSSPIVQIEYTDDIMLDGMILDLSQTPSVLIPQN